MLIVELLPEIIGRLPFRRLVEGNENRSLKAVRQTIILYKSKLRQIELLRDSILEIRNAFLHS